MQVLQALAGLVAQRSHGIDDGVDAQQMFPPRVGRGAARKVQRRAGVAAAHHRVMAQLGDGIDDVSAQKA